MKNGIKKSLLFVSSSLVLAGCLASCGGTSDTGNPASSNESQESSSQVPITGTLKVAAFEGGSGNTALVTLAQAYQKYNPDKKIDVYYSPLVRDECQTAVETGFAERDLFFVDGTTVPKGVETYHSIADISSLYETKPKTDVEEDILIKDKIDPNILAQMQYGGDVDEYKGKYYTAPFTSGPCSLIINKDAMNNVLGEGNWSAPRTSEEMFALCDRIVAAEKKIKIGGTNYKIYPFIYSEAVEYWRYLYNTWIAQYMGTDDWFNSYLTCKIDGEYSKDAFFPEAKEKGYQALERILTRTNGYCDTTSLGNKFMTSQKYFLQGRACMYVTGDWIEREMNQTDYKANLLMTRTPLLSDMATKIETTYSVSLGNDAAAKDAKLAEIVSAIDNGETSFEGLSNDAFNHLKTARGLTYTLGNSSYGLVPACSKNIDLAIDFLRFMYSDEGIQILLDDTKTMIPVKNPGNYHVNGEISEFRASVNAISNSNLTQYIFFSNNDPIRYRGGLGEHISNEKPEVAMGKKSGALTARKYLEKEHVLLDTNWSTYLQYVAE